MLYISESFNYYLEKYEKFVTLGELNTDIFKCVIPGIQLDYKENNQMRNHC